MFVVVFFWFFWKFGGFLINLLIGRLYGDVPLVKDVYTFTYKWVIFALIYPSLLKVLVPAFMPLFTERLQRDEREAWDLANTVINLFVALDVVMLCLGALFPDKLVHTLAPGFSPATQQAAAHALRVMFPGIFAMNLCILFLAVQNAYKVFSYPSAGDATQKIVWAIAILFGSKLFAAPVDAIAYGFLAGCALQIGVNLFGLRSKLKFYRPRLPLLSTRRIVKEAAVFLGFLAAGALGSFVVLPALHGALRAAHLDPEFVEFTLWLFLMAVYALQLWQRARRIGTPLARFAALAAPLLLGILFARWRDLTTAFFQSYTKAGWFGDLEMAKTIGNLPHIMLGQALAVAMLPYLCDLAAKRDWKAFGDVLTGALRLLALIFIPLTVALMVLAAPLFQLIYDSGNWREFDIMLGGAGLQFYIWGLIFFAIENALMQSFFSVQKVWWPTLLGMASAVFHILLVVGVVRWLGFDSPWELYIVSAASLPASRAFKNIVLLVVTRFHVRILPFKDTVVFAAKLAVVSAAVWAATRFPLLLTDRVTPLESLKGRSVMVDTFNFEPKGWVSRDAEVLGVERTLARGDVLLAWAKLTPTRRFPARLPAQRLPVDASGQIDLASAFQAWKLDARPAPAPAAGRRLHQVRCALAEALRRAGAVVKEVRVVVAQYAPGGPANRHYLGVGYRKAGRRSLFVFQPIQPTFQRDLQAFKLRGAVGWRFRIQMEGPVERARLRLRLTDEAGRAASATFEVPVDAAWHAISVAAAEFHGSKLSRLETLSFQDVTPVGRREKREMFLKLDDLQAVTPDGRTLTIDRFEMAGEGWTPKPKVDYIPGEKLGERALRLSGDAAETRRLDAFDLAGYDQFSCKIKASAAASLTVSFLAGGAEYALPAKALRPSKKRRRMRFELRLARAAGRKTALDPAALTAVRVRVSHAPAEAVTWIDNVAFEKRRSAKTRILFEAFKAVRVAVPSAAGFLAFVLCVWLLRIPEGRQIFDWLKTHGLDKVLARLKRKPPATPPKEDGPAAAPGE